jgi:hypothetical protein
MLEAIGGFFSNLLSLGNPLWLYYPLCAVVAVVYKATKFDAPRQIAWAALHFFVTVSLGVLALSLIFYVVSILL